KGFANYSAISSATASTSSAAASTPSAAVSNASAPASAPSVIAASTASSADSRVASAFSTASSAAASIVVSAFCSQAMLVKDNPTTANKANPFTNTFFIIKIFLMVFICVKSTLALLIRFENAL